MTISPVMPVYHRSDVAPVRGEGCYLYDAEGNEWLDFAAGIAVNALGHGHPHLTQALKKQVDTLLHVSNLYESPQQLSVAKRLVAQSFADTVFFTNSGVEAIECAVKTARAYQFAHGHPERYRLITFSHAFHGRTLTAISATDQPKLRHGFEPLPDWFHVVPFNDLAAAEAAIDEHTAGFLVEPVQGEGGVRPATQAFLQGLRRLADERGLMLVLDEVQTGVGRTGTFFAYEQYGITPDIVAIAKGIGGGFPMGACLATEKAASGMDYGMHGSTFGGNPLAMAAANAVLDVMAEPGFLPHVRGMAARLRQALEQFLPNYPCFEEVRGLGLLLGVRVKGDSGVFVAHARRAGLLLVPAADRMVRFLPPLVIEEAHIDECMRRLSQAAASYEERVTEESEE